MADSRKAPQRRLLRVCERHRLEQQLLASAYEELRPVLGQRPQRAGQRGEQAYQATLSPIPTARSA